MTAEYIQVMPRATRLLEKMFQGKTRRPIRLFVKLGGCGIRSFSVALENPTDFDSVFEIEGFRYVVDNVLLERVKPIKIDSDGYGFRISGSGVPPHHGCGNCGFACGDGSRCTGDCVTCEHRCAYGHRFLKKAEEKSGHGRG
jgi:Fe-S cluster assembly iron-binding protein IscA